MADVDITSLSVEISAESSGAELNIDKLATAISNLRTKANVSKVIDGLDKLTNSLTALKSAQGDFSGLESVTRFIDGISKVNASESAKGISTLAKSIAKLPESLTGMGALSDSVDTLLDVTDAFDLMATVQDPKGLKSAINAIKKIPEAVSGVQGISSDIGDVKSVLNGFNNLPSVTAPEGLSSFVSLLRRIPKAVSEANKADYTQLAESSRQLMNGLAPLSVLDFSNLKNLGSVLNQLNKIPDLAQKLDSKTVGDFSTACQKLSAALAPLASQLDKVGNAFAKLPPQLSKVVTQANRVTAANERQKKSYLSLSNQMNGFMRNMAKLVSLKAIAEYLGNAVAKFNDFYEATDMFTVSMGEMTESANQFINKMESLLGIDPTEAMNNMANVYSMVHSFGMASDKAYTLSQNLTQLGYDLASLKNKNPSETFTKLRSAMAGELEPVLQLGVDISQARLQQELLELGFNKQISTLSQADKATLRYIAIMKQLTYVQGNLGETLSSPANMIRMLKAQLNNLARDIGSLLYPALKSILPPLIAAVELIREFVQWVAKLMGVKVVFTDFTKSADSVGGIGDAMDDTADSTKKAAKALKDYTMGFDELNIIGPTQGSSGSGSGASAGNILGDVDLSGYDMFKNYVGNAVDEIKAKFESLKVVIAAIGLSLAGLSFAKFLTSIGEAIAKMGILKKLMASIATFTIEAVLVYKFEDAYAKTGNIADLIMSWVTTGIASYIGYKAWGPAGAVIGLTISYLMTMKAQHDNLASGNESFGDASTWVSLLNQGLKGLAAGIGVAVMTPFGVGAAAAALTGFSVAALIAFEVDLDAIRDKLSQYPIMEKISKIVEDILLAGVIAGAALVLGATAGVAGVAAVATIAIKIGFDLIFGNTDKNEDSGIDAMSGADAGVDKGLAQFETTVGKRIEETKQWWNERWDGFKENIGKSWDSLKDFAADYWQNNSLIHGLIDQTNQNVSDLKKSLGKVGEAFNQRVKDIEESAAKAGKAAAEWVNGVLDKFRKKRQEFFDAGKNLIQGFVNGVSTMIETAQNTVAGIGNSVITKMKDVLGIHSPSTVFASIGDFLMQGLVQGVENAKDYVNTAFNVMGAQAVNAAATGLGLNTGAFNAMGQAAAVQTAEGMNTQVPSTASLFGSAATYFGTTFWANLDSEWNNVNKTIQTDTIGSIQTLFTAIKDGNLEKIATWSAAYFYHNLNDEQKKQIQTFALTALSKLSTSLSGVFTNLSQLASGFIGMFVPSLATATTAQTGLNVAMDANPIMLVISLIGMFVGALVNMVNKNGDAANSMKKAWNGFGDFVSLVFEGVLRALGSTIQGFISAINVVIDAYNKLANSKIGRGIGMSSMSRLSNPLYDFADKIAQKRRDNQAARKLAEEQEKLKNDGNRDYNSEYEELMRQQQETLNSLKKKYNFTTPSYTPSSSNYPSYNPSYTPNYPNYNPSNYPGTKEWDKNNGTSFGSYGGSTTVTVDFNEEEMRESVYNGTYNAFLDIFQRYGDELTGGKELKIYLDGRQLTASVEKNQNARGMSLMGNEVYSY